MPRTCSLIAATSRVRLLLLQIIEMPLYLTIPRAFKFKKFKKFGIFCSEYIFLVGRRETRLPPGNRFSRAVPKTLMMTAKCKEDFDQGNWSLSLQAQHPQTITQLETWFFRQYTSDSCTNLVHLPFQVILVTCIILSRIYPWSSWRP